MNERKAFLYTLNIDTIIAGKQPTLLDSIKITNGKFRFKAKIPEDIMLGLISFGDEKESNNIPSDIFVVLEEGTINTNIDGQRVTISGTKRNNDLNNSLYVPINKTLDIRDEMQHAGENIDNVPLDANGMDVMRRMRSLMKEINTGLYSFTKANMTNMVGEMLFISFMKSFDTNQKSELISLSDSCYQNKDFIQYIKKKIDYRLKKDSSLIGKKFLDLELENKLGNKKRLSTYVSTGKYTLVNFWASWCGSCLEHISYLTEIYSLNQNKKFDIVSISLDNKRYDWVNALAHLKIKWTQLLDADQIAAKQYGFEAIPFNLLIDPDGIITAIELTSNNLEDRLAELLK